MLRWIIKIWLQFSLLGKFWVGCIMLLALSSCGNNHKKSIQNKDIQSNDFQNKLIEANKMYVRQESDEIDQYAKHRGWNMTTTGTGLR